MAQAAKYVGMSNEQFRAIRKSLLRSNVVQKCHSCTSPLQETITGYNEMIVDGRIVCKCSDCYYGDKADHFANSSQDSKQAG